MKNAATDDFTTTIVVDQTPEETYNAINNVRGWWSENIEGPTDKLNEAFVYHYRDMHYSLIRVTELVPGKKVVWHVLSNYFQFTKNSSEWTGTRIVFDISKKGKQTEMKFTHVGLVPQEECYKVCFDAWTDYIRHSLSGLVTTGIGSPAKKEDRFDARALEKWKSDHQTKNSHMKSKDFATTLLFGQTAKEVFKAINNVTGWWTENMEGSAKKLNDEFTVRFGETYITMRVTELNPDSRVVWLVTDCFKHYLKNNRTEWTGTKICFDIASKNKKTELHFSHLGLVPGLECYGGCANAWTGYLENSLNSLITTGTGEPDLKEKKAKAGKK